MEISKSSLSGVPLLSIAGEVDHLTASILEEEIQDSLNSGSQNLLLDMAKCPYLDSGGLGVILSTVRRQRGNGWLGVVSPNANLVRLFQIVGLGGEMGFRVFADLSEASAFLASQ